MFFGASSQFLYFTATFLGSAGIHSVSRSREQPDGPGPHLPAAVPRSHELYPDGFGG